MKKNNDKTKYERENLKHHIVRASHHIPIISHSDIETQNAVPLSINSWYIVSIP